jgi:hypothetical protein
MKMPGDAGIGTTTKVVEVFDKAAVLHVLGSCSTGRRSPAARAR